MASKRRKRLPLVGRGTSHLTDDDYDIQSLTPLEAKAITHLTEDEIAAEERKYKPRELTEKEAKKVFIERMLQLLGDSGDVLTSEATWGQIGVYVTKSWALFDSQQTSFSTLRMIKECAEMMLKIKLADNRLPQDDANMQQLDAMMNAIFQPQAHQESLDA